MTANTPTAAHDLVLILWSLIVGMVAGVAFGVLLVRVFRTKHRCPTPLPSPTAVLPRVETPRVEAPTFQFPRVRGPYLVTDLPERPQPQPYRYGGRSHVTHNGATK